MQSTQEGELGKANAPVSIPEEKTEEAVSVPDSCSSESKEELVQQENCQSMNCILI